MGETIRKRLRQNTFDSPVHEAILNLIVAAAHVRARLDVSCARHGITGVQYNVLRILKGAYPEGYPRGEIACRLLDRAPDVTRLTDRLEREGLVERVRTEADKRLSITRITRKGIRLVETLKPEIERDMRQIAKRLSHHDATELSRICEGLYASTKNEHPRPASPGIHHVTAIAGDPQENVSFYAGLLGLRLVKRTVNFDDPGTYHLYFGDAAGRPGTLMTFFPWAGAARGRAGVGQVTHTSFSVPPGSLDYWKRRIEEEGHAVEGPWTRLGERGIGFSDADGLGIELIESAEAGAAEAWREGPVPAEHAIRSFHGVTLTLADHARTADVLTGALGFESRGAEGERQRYAAAAGGAASRVDLVASPNTPRGRMGVGVVHHVAWRAPGEQDQLALRAEAERRNLHPTPVVDRCYFRSVYFREPGGVLFEVATDAPGMAMNESPDFLGMRLMLPPWLESIRPRIEETLPPLTVPAAGTAR